MFKLLMLGLLAWILVSILRKKLTNHTNKQPPGSKDAKPAEAVIPCQYCGVHIPQSSAISHKQQYFCSQQHRDAHEMAES